MVDIVYFNAVDLRTYLTPIGLLKMHGIPPAVGQDYEIPGYVGALEANLGRGPRTVQVGGLIMGPDLGLPTDPPVASPAATYSPPQPQVHDVEAARAAFDAKLNNFIALIYNYDADKKTGSPATLTWQTGPPTALVTRSAYARYSGGLDEIEQLTPWAARVAVDFLLLTPFWAL